MPGPTPAQVLRSAADYIERHGWNQGFYYNLPGTPTPAACAVGAIAITCYGEPVEDPQYTFTPGRGIYLMTTGWLHDYLCANDIADRAGIPSWNDHPNTTGIDVTDAMRDAAQAWEAQHTGGDPA
jgi:hypothetical protein